MHSLAPAKIRILSDIFTIFASWTTKRIKVIRRAIKIFWHTIVAIASFLFAAALAIQLPQVQTYVAGKVMDTLSEKLDGDITFEKIHFKPFTTLVLKNAVIIDRNPYIDPIDPASPQIDTFFRAEYVIAKFSLEGLRKHEGIHLDKAFIRNAQMNLVLEESQDTVYGDRNSVNLTRIFRLKKKEEPKKSEKEIFHIKKVEIVDMGFAMKDYKSDRKSYDEGGISWADLDVKNINLKAKELQFVAGVMSGELTDMSFREKSGYEVESLTGNARVGNGKTIIEDLHIDDLWSDVRLSLFMMSYENTTAFKDFIGRVKLDGNILESNLDFRTISYFAPSLTGNMLNIDVTGSMSGCINDFIFTDVKVNSTSGRFRGTANGRITGIPDILNTTLDARLNGFSLTTYGLDDFLAQWTKDRQRLGLDRFADGTVFSLNATGKGLINNLAVDADIRSAIGEADANVRLDNIVVKEKPIGIAGNVKTEDLDIGKIINNDILGPTSLKTTLQATLGNEDIPSELKIDTLKIDRLNANDYDYSDITAVGNVSSNGFDGRIVCHDPNLNFLFQGAFALSAKTKNARYKFFTNIGHADLNAINIDKRGLSRVHLRASADFTKSSAGDMRGKIDIADIELQNSEGNHNIGNINLVSYSSDSTYVVRMDSRFLNGNYTGSAPVTTFVEDLKGITLKKELPSLFEDASYRWNGNTYRLSFKFNNSMDLLSFAMPGLYIDEGTVLNADVDKHGKFTAAINSNRLAFKRNYLKDIDADLNNADDALDCSLRCSEVKVASISLKDSYLNLHGDDDHIGMRFDYDNASELANMGEVILRSTLTRDDNILDVGMEFLPSSVFVNAKEWNIEPSELSLKGGLIDVKTFSVTSGEEVISIDGKASRENPDTLSLNLSRFDLAMVNEMVGKDLGIDGAATGTVQLTSPLKKKGILIDMICDSTYFSDVPLGTLNLESRWNEDDQNFGILVRNEIDGRSSIHSEGTLTPTGEILDITANLNRMSIGYAQPLLSDVFSEMAGSISGRIALNGPISNLNISSEDTYLEDALLKVDYTNVPYHADGSFHLDSTGVYFNNIAIRDDYTGTGTINGSINWDHFRDMSFNTSISVNEIEGINIVEDNGQGFYGNIFGTGNVSITGPMKSILLTVDAVTAKTGQLHIPLTSAASREMTNLLRFKEEEVVEKVDPYEAMMVRMIERENATSDFRVKLHINAQPEVQAFVEIDKATGNVLSGYGNGLLDIEAGSDVFNINGDYILQGGSYKFVAMGLVSRDFEIESGSSIKFNGDIMNSTLDINAIYRTKASLARLLSDESSVTNKRNVNCGISITDRLSNPELGFSIDIPDLNPMIKSRVESALSTEDKIQKQFLSLIIYNSFLPDEQSGIVNNSSLLYSNVTGALANQLNNIFHKLDIPLDLGLNYQPNESGNDIFDVAVSTQLFNNRVVVNGNIGNKQYSTSGSQNDVVGDLDIEIKLNRSGAFRLNLFSHSADQFSNYLDNSQRNGVGVTYQTEFNSFVKFLRNIFLSKTKRQEAKMQEEQSMIQGKKINFRIEAPEEKDKDKTYGR